MREKIRKVAQSIWGSINTNAGAAIVGVGVTYFFTRGAREEELARAKINMELADKKISDLEQSLRDSYQNSAVLLKSMVDKSNTENSLKLSLEQCERHRSMITYAFQNSTCLLRQKYPHIAIIHNEGNEQTTANVPHLK